MPSAALSQSTDEELLSSFRDHGQRLAFQQLVHRYERELYSYLRRYLGDADLAEDVFQATFLQVHLRSHQFENGRRFRPWLYAIATHQAIDAHRRNRRHKMLSLDRRGQYEDEDASSLMEMLVSDEPSPVASLSGQENGQWVRRSVADLPDPLRAVVTLVYYQGLKYRDVAEALGVPVGTVKSRMHAAVAKLNQAWSESHPDETN